MPVGEVVKVDSVGMVGNRTSPFSFLHYSHRQKKGDASGPSFCARLASFLKAFPPEEGGQR